MIKISVRNQGGLILGTRVVGEAKGFPVVVIDWDGVDPEYLLESKGRGGATLSVREGDAGHKKGSRRPKATLRFTGLPLPARELKERLVVLRHEPGVAYERGRESDELGRLAGRLEAAIAILPSPSMDAVGALAGLRSKTHRASQN